MRLLNHLTDIITQAEFAVVEGDKRKIVLRIVHGRGGYHVLAQTGAVKLYTPAFTLEAEARKHASACQVDIWRIAQARTAGLEELVEAILTRA